MTTEISTTSANPIHTAFPFSVDKFPLAGPDGMSTPHYGLFRSDNSQCVGVACKQGYTPHTVDDVSALYEAAKGAFSGEATVSAAWRDGHYVVVAPSREHRAAIFGTNDNIFPRLTIRASYDGRAFRGELGLYRDACKNLHVIRSAGRSFSANIRHTFGLREKLDDLRRTFTQLAGGWDSVVETARQLEAHTVGLSDFIRQVYPLAEGATDRTRRAAEKRTELIVRRIMSERVALGRQTLANRWDVTLWEALNGVQGYVQHDQHRHGRPDRLNRAIIALDDPAVTRATELALSLAS